MRHATEQLADVSVSLSSGDGFEVGDVGYLTAAGWLPAPGPRDYGSFETAAIYNIGFPARCSYCKRRIERHTSECPGCGAPQ